jgi:hypothetical protein
MVQLHRSLIQRLRHRVLRQSPQPRWRAVETSNTFGTRLASAMSNASPPFSYPKRQGRALLGERRLQLVPIISMCPRMFNQNSKVFKTGQTSVFSVTNLVSVFSAVFSRTRRGISAVRKNELADVLALRSKEMKTCLG